MRNSVFLLLILIGSGCIWENEETLFPDDSFCDTLDVSYQDDVVPIMVNNCYSCHSNVNAPSFGSGIALEDHEDLAAASPRVLGAVMHQDGFPPMPRNAEKLDTCSIATIHAWVNAGTPDN